MVKTRVGRLPIRLGMANTHVGGVPIRAETANTRVGGIPIRLEIEKTCVGGIPISFETANTRVDGVPIRFGTANTRVGGVPIRLGTARTRPRFTPFSPEPKATVRQRHRQRQTLARLRLAVKQFVNINGRQQSSKNPLVQRVDWPRRRARIPSDGHRDTHSDCHTFPLHHGRYLSCRLKNLKSSARLPS